MAQCPVQMIERLKEIVGDRAVLTDPAELIAYESDGLTEFRMPPDAVVLPRSAEQVRAVVRLCNQYDVPIVPRGAGTGLSGGCVAARGGIMIGFSRMNRILEIDCENRVAVVEPGVLNLQLSDLTMPKGYYYAPDPSSQAACTLGGNVAENSGGPHCLKYGMTVNHVLGLEVVTADGDRVTLGGGAPDAVGYDLLGLFIGSEGTFGIVTKITVRLEQTPQGVRTLLADYLGVADACRTVSDIIAAGIIPAALELMDKRTVSTVEDSVLAAGYPRDAEAVLIIELDGYEKGLDDQASRVTHLCRKNNARSVRMALDEAERKKLWAGRKAAFGAAGRLSPDLLVQDAVVPRRRLAEILPKIYEICDRHGVRVSNVFHAGDGNLHPNMNYDSRNPEEAARVKEALREIMRLCVSTGGTITGEHGVGLEKIEFMDLIFGPDTLEAMRRVREVWNPKNLFNPGKVLPDPSVRAKHAPSGEPTSAAA